MDLPLEAVVFDPDRPAAEVGWQRHDEGGEHAGLLLGVAVGHEEVVRAVEQELVEVGFDGTLDAQALGGGRADVSDAGEEPGVEVEPGGVDLVAATDVGVEEGVGALSVGGGGGVGQDELADGLAEGEGQRAEASDADHGEGGDVGAAGHEGPGTVERREEGGDGVEGAHGGRQESSQARMVSTVTAWSAGLKRS